MVVVVIVMPMWWEMFGSNKNVELTKIDGLIMECEKKRVRLYGFGPVYLSN